MCCDNYISYMKPQGLCVFVLHCNLHSLLYISGMIVTLFSLCRVRCYSDRPAGKAKALLCFKPLCRREQLMHPCTHHAASHTIIISCTVRFVPHPSDFHLYDELTWKRPLSTAQRGHCHTICVEWRWVRSSFYAGYFVHASVTRPSYLYAATLLSTLSLSLVCSDHTHANIHTYTQYTHTYRHRLEFQKFT